MKQIKIDGLKLLILKYEMNWKGRGGCRGKKKKKNENKEISTTHQHITKQKKFNKIISIIYWEKVTVTNLKTFFIIHLSAPFHSLIPK